MNNKMGRLVRACIEGRIFKSLKIRAGKAGYVLSLMVHNTVTRFWVIPFKYSPILDRADARPADRKRPFFLVLRHRYFFGGAENGNSNEEHILSGPLKSADIADTVEYYYDTDYLGGFHGDQKLVELAANLRPDLIVLSSYNPTRKQYPGISVIQAIRTKLETPVLVMWSDTTTQTAVQTARRISGIADYNVMNESGYLAERFPESSRYIQLWASLDFSVFHPGKQCRNIPVSFLGTTNWYRGVRQTYLDYLNMQEIPVHQAGGKDDPLTLDQYADIIRRSKISINFSHSVGDTHQLKGRVFEILFSGTLLLENENLETPKFFTPMVDYVPFSSKMDLAEKIRYYLEHENERKLIAERGYHRAITEYNHNEFWNIIMSNIEDLGIMPRPASRYR